MKGTIALVLPEGASGNASSPIDWVAFGSLLLVGLGSSLWITRVFSMESSPSALWKRVRASITLIIGGSLPSGVLTWALTPTAGFLAMVGFSAGAGLGFLWGFWMDRNHRDIFARSLALRLRAGKTPPTPVEAFAFALKYGSSLAEDMLGLDSKSFEDLYEIGTDAIESRVTALDLTDNKAVLAALCGTPVCQVARDYGLTPLHVADLLRETFADGI